MRQLVLHASLLFIALEELASNHHFEVVSSGKRDPDAEGTTGMSGTKMRGAVQDDDFDLFSQGLPRATTKRLARSLFNAIRKAI